MTPPTTTGAIPTADPVPVSTCTPRRRRVWPGIVAGAVAVGLIPGFFIATILLTSHDRIDFIDDPAVADKLVAPCARIQTAAGKVDPASDPATRALALDGVVAAIHDLTAGVAKMPTDLVDGDMPTRGWAEDWNLLADRINAYSAELRAGVPAPELDTPLTEDGYTVVFRMDVAAPSQCAVPQVIRDLDPTPPPWPDNP